MLVGLGVGVSDELCSEEHAKRENAKVRVKRAILVFTKDTLISLLLADRVLQNS
jgi:hypothetical protein